MHKKQYRHADAQKHQEIITPPELVEHIYSFLDLEEMKDKDILDPCVGPGALIEPILENKIPCNLTILDIQKEHIENLQKCFQKYTPAVNIQGGTGDFLEMPFGTRKFDYIIMNPPWVKIGPQFIEKARTLLKKGGKLVCVIGYNQFTNLKGNPGSFNYLQKFCSFERIEVFKGMSKIDYFGNYGTGVGDWCWFIWRNEKLNINTHIVNRLGEEFQYTLKGNEMMVPQIPNETDYFDWDSGEFPTAFRTMDKAVVNSIYIILRTNSIKIGELEKGVSPPNQCAIIKNISLKSIERLIKNINLWALYADSTTGDKLRCPPIKRNNA